MASKLFAYSLKGRRALFTDPVSRMGGEKMSYLFPTYQALKGITESIYWKPTFIWQIRRVRVMAQIQTESVGVRPIKFNSASANELSYYTYLRDVHYQVEVQFDWNYNRTNLEQDRDFRKHEAMFERSLAKGGRRDIFLGTRECQGYVAPCVFGEGEGAYDNVEQLGYGIQFHSFIYPDENREVVEKKGVSYADLKVNLWQPVLKNGILTFPDPEECPHQRVLYQDPIRSFTPGENFSFLEDIHELVRKLSGSV